MSVKIRLKRLGKIRAPYYRIVVADSRTKRDGRVIEEIGKYHPTEEPSFIEIDSARAQYWLGVGAQPTEQVTALLKLSGDWGTFKGEKGAKSTIRTKEGPSVRRRREEEAGAEAEGREAQGRAEGRGARRRGSGRRGGSRCRGSAAEAPAAEDAGRRGSRRGGCRCRRGGSRRGGSPPRRLPPRQTPAAETPAETVTEAEAAVDEAVATDADAEAPADDKA